MKHKTFCGFVFSPMFSSPAAFLWTCSLLGFIIVNDCFLNVPRWFCAFVYALRLYYFSHSVSLLLFAIYHLRQLKYCLLYEAFYDIAFSQLRNFFLCFVCVPTCTTLYSPVAVIELHGSFLVYMSFSLYGMSCNLHPQTQSLICNRLSVNVWYLNKYKLLP